MLLQSEPSGAQVLIDGTLQGTTPLRLERKPGSTIQVTIRRGSRVWRGTLRLEQKSDQEIMIRLPRQQPVAAQAPARPRPASTPVPAATVVNPQAHFAALMGEGVQLYRSGWYGPAMGRFRQASAVMPASPRPYLWLGRAGIRAQRYREARGALERVIALAPASDAAREAQMLLNRLRNVPETTTSG
jgi:Flp pilus assembly protein TadD